MTFATLLGAFLLAAPASAEEPAAAVEGAEKIDKPVSEVEGPRAIDKILPCGVRVSIAEDGTLPVASVVLAVERGAEDDPEDIAGLHHALAYHLLQGNREMAPGGIAQLVHDGGGVTSLATGPGQIRFESLVPVSTLAALIGAEANRLRAPTVVDELWRDSLIWARRDPARRWGAPLPAMAMAHGVPNLGRNGREVSAELMKMDARAVAAALADRFRYERATLVIVGPHPPLATLALVDAHFSDLPPRTRQVVDRTPRRGTGAEPREVEVKGATGSAFVWPVDPTPAAIAWAKVWCRTINRQRQDKAEDRKARLKCRLDEDPRRPILTLNATGTDDPWALLEGRVRRIADGAEERLLKQQVEIVRDELVHEIRTPMGLARVLAQADADAAPTDDNRPERALAELTGLAALTDTNRFPPIEAQFAAAAAVHVVGAPAQE